MHQNNHHTRPVRPRRSNRLVLLVVLAAGALLAAACGDDDGEAAASSGGSGDPSVSITSPADGAEVGTSFDVEMALGFEIGEPETGNQHIHLHFDGSDEYDIVYTDTHTAELEPGEHTVVAVVANADHSETDIQSEPVSFTVTDDAGASQDAPQSTGGDDTDSGSNDTGGDHSDDMPTTGGGGAGGFDY
jgi:hypothetical protein